MNRDQEFNCVVQPGVRVTPQQINLHPSPDRRLSPSRMGLTPTARSESRTTTRDIGPLAMDPPSVVSRPGHAEEIS